MCVGTMPRAGSSDPRAEYLRNHGPHAVRTSSGVPVPSTTTQPAARSQVAVRGADPGVELGPGALEPIAVGATRASATASGTSSTTTRSGSSPPAAHALSRSTSSTPSPAPAPWYASVDGA